MNTRGLTRNRSRVLLRPAVTTLSALCLTVGLSFAQNETGEKREELSKLRVELEQTEGELDSLRTVESDLLKKLSGLDQRIALDRDVIKQITAKLDQLRRQKAGAEKLLQLRQTNLQGAKSQFSDQMRSMYLNRYYRPEVPLDPLSFVSAAPAPEFREVYFASLSEQTRRDIAAATDSAKRAESRLQSVTSSAQEAERLKKKRTVSASIRETQRESSKRSLAKVRQSKESVADRLLYLSEAAQQMSQLVARLEASERERAGVSPWESQQTGLFIARKGQMKPPLAGGKIVGGYGWKTDNVTNLKSFSPGVEIHGKPNYNVRAIAEGVIVYVGSLRGYGNFVIVAHDDGFYSTYGGLGRVKVQLDQRIPEREPVGVTDDGIVKFELRRGQEAVDPIEWLDFGQIR